MGFPIFGFFFLLCEAKVGRIGLIAVGWVDVVFRGGGTTAGLKVRVCRLYGSLEGNLHHDRQGFLPRLILVS